MRILPHKSRWYSLFQTCQHKNKPSLGQLSIGAYTVICNFDYLTVLHIPRSKNICIYQRRTGWHALFEFNWHMAWLVTAALRKTVSGQKACNYDHKEAGGKVAPGAVTENKAGAILQGGARD
ncbi:MAG: hypothetical protein ACN4GM_00945 [Gammaproteobacteria bacterium]